MRVVTGTVESSSRVSLSKAAVILARFADADTAAPLEVAAYVRRASASFDELADFHQEIKLSRKRAESETYKEEHSEEEEEKKKRKRKRGAEGEERSNLSDGGIAEREIGVVGDGNLVMENERRKKKRKKEAKEEEMYGFEVKEENNGRVEEERNEERKKKKKKDKGDLDEEERYTYKKNKNYLDIGKDQGELVDQSEQHKKKKKMMMMMMKRKKSEAED